MIEIITRKEAKEKNLVIYFTGNPCKGDHVSERFTSSGACILCKKQKYSKKYYENNSEYIMSKSTEYRKNNIELRKEYDKTRNLSELYKKYKKQWRKSNRNKINEYDQKRKNNDINFKLACRLRIRLRGAIKNNQKIGSAVSDLGCNINDLKLYLERMFTIEMSWENWGVYWHIDHIKPLAAFDLTDRNQFLEACHYTNLQPLYWRDNLIKGNKVFDG
jgi:hypothetical protein